MVRIELLGTSFTVDADESPEYLNQLIEYLHAQVQQIEKTVATGDPLKKAILAALLVTDELFQQRQKDASGPVVPEAEEMERIASRMITLLDQNLE